MRSQTARGGKPNGHVTGSSGAPPNGARRNSQKGNSSPQAPDTLARNKLVDLVATSCGKTVVATVSSGAQYRGVMSSADISPTGSGPLSVVLVRPTLVAKPVLNEKSNVDEKLPQKLVIQARDLIDIEVSRAKEAKDKRAESPAEEKRGTPEPKTEKAEVKTEKAEIAKPEVEKAEKVEAPKAKYEVPKGKITESHGFKTDRDISSGYKLQERELQRWVPDEDTPLMELGDSTGGWDQFKVNQEKFGVESSYDEHLYTTKINTEAKDYHERLKRAEQVAREIEGSSSTDRHVLEERGVAVDDSGLTEEDKYSGVVQDAPVDTRGNELMAALRNASISNESAGDVPKGYEVPKGGAHYHDDPAIVSSSAAPKQSRGEKPVSPQKAPVSIPPKPQNPGDAVRLNAQSEFNALREFSANFKVPHKMPNDLLPILANDKLKQDEILKKQRDGEKGEKKAPAPAEPKKPAKTFKLNPKAAAFTPMSSMSPTPPKATFNKSPKNQSPRMQTQRPYSGGAGGSRRHFQITAAEFFGGADRVPTAKSQKEKSEKFHKSFNLFRTAQRNHKDASAPLILEKAFRTPPTWDSTVDQTYEELNLETCAPESSPMGPNAPFMGSPAMGVPGGSPMMPGGFPPTGGKFPMSPQMNPMAQAHLQQQFHAAMMYQGFQPGMPGQPMYGPPGMDPQFMPGFMAPGFGGSQSPVSGNMPMNVPHASSPVHGQGRRTQKRGSQGEK